MLRLVLLLGLAAALLVALLDYLGNLDVNLVGSLLQFEILAELLGDCRKQLVRNLCIGVRVDLDTLLVEEVHEDVKTDIVLSDYLAKSDICHSLSFSLQILPSIS